MDTIQKIIELVPRVTDADVIRELSYPANGGLLTFERLNRVALSLTITKDFACLKSHTSVIREKFFIDSDDQVQHPETMVDFMKEHGIDSLFRGSVVYRTIRQVQAIAMTKGQTPIIFNVLSSLIESYEIPGDRDNVMYKGILLSCLLGDTITFKHGNGVSVTIRHKHGTTTSLLKISQKGKVKFNNAFSLGDGPLIFNKLIPEWEKYINGAVLQIDDVYEMIGGIRENIKDDIVLVDLLDTVVNKCGLNESMGGI